MRVCIFVSPCGCVQVCFPVPACGLCGCECSCCEVRGSDVSCKVTQLKVTQLKSSEALAVGWAILVYLTLSFSFFLSLARARCLSLSQVTEFKSSEALAAGRAILLYQKFLQPDAYMQLDVPENLWRNLAVILEDEEAVLEPVREMNSASCFPSLLVLLLKTSC